jgi:hypothetical protein
MTCKLHLTRLSKDLVKKMKKNLYFRFSVLSVKNCIFSLYSVGLVNAMRNRQDELSFINNLG